MAPFVCLVAGFLVFRALGLAFAWFADWRLALRPALRLMLLLTASAHWGKLRPDLVCMVPRWAGNAGVWVSVTGAAEAAIAIGLQIPQLALAEAAAAVAMLCALFPANVKAARECLTLAGKPVLPVYPRLVLQAIFVAALAGAAWPQ